LLLAAGLLGACNVSNSNEAGQVGVPGSEDDKPGGGTFFVDPNEGGGASRLLIAEMFWGRLVDVHGLNPLTMEAELTPAFADLTINEGFVADGVNYVLETNPVTLKTKLIIQRVKGAPDLGNGTFIDLLRTATASMPPIIPKHDDGSSTEPFSFIARNAVLVIRVNDMLEDSAQTEEDLYSTVRVATGYRPETPFIPRLRFDPNYGGIAQGAFHSTRIIVDMTVSEAEAADTDVPLGVNVIGLPASLTTTGQPNVSVRIPSKEDYGSGQFVILRSINGKPMTTSSNGPVDWTSSTLDLVRAMRAGNTQDTSNGFMRDDDEPQIVGGWQFAVNNANDDPVGLLGHDFVFDLAFATPCMATPGPGDILALTGGYYLEVTELGVPPDPVTGIVNSVRVRLLAGDAVTNLNVFLGGGIYLRPYAEGLGIADACWLTFTPQPGTHPASAVSPDAQVMLRFNEPMDPDSVNPFDTLLMVRGDATTARHASNTVVGGVGASTSLKDFTYTPLLPFAHAQDSQPYNLRLGTGTGGVTDLAGNVIEGDIPSIEFTIDPAAAEEANGGISLRFDSIDEYDYVPGGPPDGWQDLRGQLFYDFEREVITPRPVHRSSFPADLTNPIPSAFLTIPGGVQTPLIPLGSKLMALWRYVDFGFSVRDETKMNLDVEGLNWAPSGGQLITDFFELFEIRLAHSKQLPDEEINALSLLPNWPQSGLFSAPQRFDSNILATPDDQLVVHNRALGYRINPIDLFTSTSGTQMVPFPLNEGTGQRTDFTWRDTADLNLGAINGAGIPMGIEFARGIDGPPGSIAGSGNVPTIGLPLLMEFRCFPSNEGLGLNSLSVAQVIAGTNIPFFRIFSSGGYDANYNTVVKDPDLELVPTGGYNPNSVPPGAPTPPADNIFYIGQLDSVIRVSRIHTVWFDSGGIGTPDYQSPVIEPGPGDQPEGTGLLLDFRGASSFAGTNDTQYDATTLDWYGNTTTGTVTFFGDGTWSRDIDAADGATFLQVRFTFINNVLTNRNAELSSFGVAFAGQ